MFSKWDPSATRQEISEWINRDGQEQFMCSQPKHTLKEYIAGCPLDIGKLLVALGALGVWYSSKGVISLLEADQAQDYMTVSLQYETVYFLLRHAYRGVSKKDPGIRFYAVGLALCKAIALGRFSLADRLIQIALTVMKRYQFKTSTSKVTPFAVALYGKWRQIPLPPLPEPLVAQYNSVLYLWDSTDLAAVTAALVDACDFHTYRTQKSTPREMFEFENQEYKLYPVEILAVLRLRQMRGLPLPDLDHPLMNTPLGHLRETPPVAPDRLIDDLLKKLRIEFPSLPEFLD
ncbi:MAG TPA: hypothetical protein VJX67_17595 [Blastocatellia bacterium]|nr:hypothetical protein [Blastocatellia bacterium]